MIGDGSSLDRRTYPCWVGYVVTVVAEVAVAAVLHMLVPVFPLANFPIPYVLVMMTVVYFYGDGPAILAFFLGLLLFAYTSPPYHRIWPLATTAADWAGLVALLMGSSVVGFAVHAMRKSRNRAEELAVELQQMNQRTSDTLESIAECFFAVDSEWRFQDVNRVAQESIFRRPAQDLLGKSYFSEYPHAVDSEFYRQCQSAIANQHEAHFEEQFEPDGRWFECHAFPRNGRLEVYLRDITVRRQAQEALRESETRYRSLIETMNEGFASADRDYVFTYVNPRLAEMLGYRPEEMIGHRIEEFLDEANRATMREQARHRREGRRGGYELAWMARDGQLVHTLVSPGPIFDSDGEFAGSFAVITDITQRKLAEEKLRKSEERFRNLFERAADGLFLHDLNGRFIEVNQAACDTLGYSRDELLELGVADIVPDYDQEQLQKVWAHLLSSGPLTVYTNHRRKDGSVLPVEGRLSPFEYRDQVLILALVRDVTERMRVEEERRALEKHVEDQKRLFYRETILSVTDGKLDICEDCDMASYLSSSELSVEVRTSAQVSSARRAVADFCRVRGLTGDSLDSFVIGVGEAITNAIKHGTQGIVHAGVKDKAVWVGVKDDGPGIGSLILPRAVLLRGFSTKPSLGLGYCVMLDVADHIHLKTDEHGTLVILEKMIEDHGGRPPLRNLPDTWSSIPSWE